VLYSLKALLYSFKCACALKKKANESCSPHYRQCCNTGRVVTVCKMREIQPNAKIKTSGEAKSKQSIMEKEQGARSSSHLLMGSITRSPVEDFTHKKNLKPRSFFSLLFSRYQRPKRSKCRKKNWRHLSPQERAASAPCPLPHPQ